MKLIINGVEINNMKLKDIPPIVRDVKNRGTDISFNLLGYPYSTSYIPYQVEVRSQNGDLKFIGNLGGYAIEYNPGNPPDSVIRVRDFGRHLIRLPVFGIFQGSFKDILEALITVSGAAPFLLPVTYKVGLVKAQRNIKMLMINSISPLPGQFILIGNLRVIFVESNPLVNQILIDPMPDLMALALHSIISNADPQLTNCTSEISGNTLTLTSIFPSLVFDLVSDSPSVTTIVFQDASMGGGVGEDISLEDTRLRVSYLGSYLLQIIEDLTSTVGVNWYLDSRTGKIVIYQTGINDPAHTINTANFFTCSNKNKALSYNASFPKMTSALVHGYNGEIRQRPENLIPQELARDLYTLPQINDISLAETSLSYNDLAYKVVAVRITTDQAQPPIVENCRINEITVTGRNFLSINDFPTFVNFLYHDYFIPGDLLTATYPINPITTIAELIYTGSINNVGNQALISILGDVVLQKNSDELLFGLNGGFFALQKININIKINNNNVFNRDIDLSNRFYPINYKLTDYIGNPTLDFEVKFTLNPQTNSPIEGFTPDNYLTTDITNGTISVGVSCCIGVIIGGSINNFNANGGFFGDGGDSRFALFRFPRACIFKNNNYYVADTGNFRVRKITGSFTVSTIAGGGIDFPINGLDPLNCSFGAISGVEYYNGEVYFTDSENKLLCKINTNNQLEVIASFTGSSYPSAIYIDSIGNIYLADSGRHVIYKIDSGTTTPNIIAGTLNSVGFSGDGNQATSAQLNKPYALTIYNNNLYFCDVLNHRLRKIDLGTGIITTVAGTGNPGFNGDWIVATNADLNFPSGVAIEDNGDIVIVDPNNKRIRRIDIITGIISTIAGNGLIREPFRDRFDYIAGTAMALGLADAYQFNTEGLGGQCFIDLESDKELVVAENANSNITKFYCRTNPPSKVTCPNPLINIMNPTGDLNFVRHDLSQVSLPSGLVLEVPIIRVGVTPVGKPSDVTVYSPNPINASGSIMFAIDLRSMSYNGHVLVLRSTVAAFSFAPFRRTPPPLSNDYSVGATTCSISVDINNNNVFNQSRDNFMGSSGFSEFFIFDLTPFIGTLVVVNFTGQFSVGLDSDGGVQVLSLVGTSVVTGDFTVSCGQPCDAFSYSPSSAFFEAIGGSGSIDILADSLCMYTASTNNTWINLIDTTGIGDGSIRYTVEAHENPDPRDGIITLRISGGSMVNIAIQQAGFFINPCDLLRYTNINIDVLVPGRDVLILIPNDNPYDVQYALSIFIGIDANTKTGNLTANIDLTDSRIVDYVTGGGFIYLNYRMFAQAILDSGQTGSALARLVMPFGTIDAFADESITPIFLINNIDITSLAGSSFSISYFIELIANGTGLRLDGSVDTYLSCTPLLPPEA